MSFQILCDSCCDFTATEKLGAAFEKVPATVTVSGQKFLDDGTFQQSQFLRSMEAESIELQVEFPDEQAYLNAFDREADAVYIVTAAAASCDQYGVASRARRMYLREHPEKQIHVFNTRSAGVGELLAARQIRRMERYGCNFRQIVSRVEADILTSNTYFMPSSPDSLRQIGLLPKKILPEKPFGIYQAVLEGGLSRPEAAFTEKGAGKKLAAMLENQNLQNRLCLLSHCGCRERAQHLAGLLRQQTSASEIIILETGAVMSLLLHRGGIALAF